MAESIHRHNHKECCMCGDFGFPNALFHCRICLFRSQHKYCSDLYPKAECYHICNWCLRDKDSRPAPLSTADDSSASSGISSNGDEEVLLGPKKKFVGFDRRLSVQVHSIKKSKFHGDKNQEAGRKTTADGKEDDGRNMGMIGRRSSSFGRTEDVILLRTKSEDLSNAKIGTPRQMGRGKVRRYKLLEEVSN